jgi:L-ascorbate metabolism protein UlaG (beta-lactamase superfamily)
MRRLVLVCSLVAAGCAGLPMPQNATYHGSDADLGVTRIVHGSLILEMAKTRVLVDPWFHSHVFTEQTEPLGLTPSGLPDVTAILITHGHPAHFDEETLGELAKKVPRAIAPPQLEAALTKLGFEEVTPLDWWDHTEIGPIRVTAVPAHHPVRENGYVLTTDRARVYLAGDTRWFDGMIDIATAFPDLDVAFLPVGGEQLLGIARTMNPVMAAKAAALLKPKRVVPIAYGATGGFPFVWYSRQPVARFQDEAKAAGFPPERIIVLQPGESWHYYR